MRGAMRTRLLGGLMIVVATTPAGARAGDLSEIVVTARRVEEKPLDVPLSISSVSAEQIGAGSIEGLQSLANKIPGLFFESIWGGGNSFPILRGQNQPNLAGDNVGLFVDGVYQANRDAIDVEPLDLERIEVVKGPQSALFGRSTFAGLINYVPASPAEAWLAKASADAGTDGYLRMKAALSGPVGATWKFRIAASWRKAEGTWSNSVDPAQQLGGFRRFAVAGTIATRDGTGPFSLRLSGRYGEGRSNQPPFYRLDYPSYNCGGRDAISQAWSYFCGKPPVPDRLALSPEIRDSQNRSGQLALHFGLDLGGVELRSDSSYYEAAVHEVRDMDASALGQLFGVCLAGFSCNAPASLNVSVQRIVSVNSVQMRRVWAREFGQELRLMGAERRRFSWQIGAAAYWTRNRSTTSVGAARGSLASNERLTSLVYSNPARVGALAAMNSALVEDPNAAQIVQNDAINRRRTLALFATADLRITPRLGMRAEVRTNWERLASGSIRANFQPSFGNSLGTTTFFDVTPRFALDFRPASSWLLFASYARGSRSGGTNTVPNLVPDERTFAPETNWTAELGLKYSGNGLLRSLEATAYHIDWRDTQITGLSATPGITALITRNTHGIENWGLEVGAQIVPARWLILDGALSYTHPRFKQGSEDPGSNGFCGLSGGATTSSFCRIRSSQFNPAQLVPDISHNVPARTVEWSWTAGVTLAPTLAALQRWRLHIGASYQGNVNDRQIGGLYYGEHLLLDARLTLPLGPVSLEAWGTNLTNARYIRLAAGSAGPLFFINQPRPTDLLLSEGRRIGLTLRYEN